MNPVTSVDDLVSEGNFDALVASLKKIFDSLPVVHDAEQLRSIELSIATATDALAARLTKLVVERSVRDNKLNNQALTFIKQSNKRLKNHGVRPVTIHPYRGAPFTIETAYFYKAGHSKSKAEKKGGSIHT